MVKAWAAITLGLMLLLPASGCAPTDPNVEIQQTTVQEESGRELNGSGRSESPTAENPATPDFSYAEDAALYQPGDPGVNPHGFVNTDSQPTDSQEAAVERATNECTVSYDATEVWYDPDAGMWKVLFYTEGMVGGGQTVYLGSDGVTNLVVYGE